MVIICGFGLEEMDEIVFIIGLMFKNIEDEEKLVEVKICVEVLISKFEMYKLL